MPIRLLLADPDAILRASLVEQLEREGAYQITAVGSAAEVLEAARHTPFALAIIDQTTCPKATATRWRRRCAANQTGLPDPAAGLRTVRTTPLAGGR